MLLLELVDGAMTIGKMIFIKALLKKTGYDSVLKNWRIVKVATTKAQRKLFFNLRKAKSRLAWLNEEEISVIAEDIDI